jgi:hypothetical protein
MTERGVASVAGSQRLPLFTRNADDFAGLESVVDVIGI